MDKKLIFSVAFIIQILALPYGQLLISIILAIGTIFAFVIAEKKEIRSRNRINFSVIQFLESLDKNKQITPFKDRVNAALKPDYPFEKDYLAMIKEYEASANFNAHKINRYNSKTLNEITWIISKGIQGAYVDEVLHTLYERVLKEKEMRNKNYNVLSNLQFITTAANLAFIPAFAGISFVILKYEIINQNAIQVFPLVISFYLVESNIIVSLYKKLTVKEKTLNAIIYSSISLIIFNIISRIAMIIV